MPSEPRSAEAASAHVVFPLLAHVSRYRACETDLLKDSNARSHWLRVFEKQLPMQLEAAVTCGATEGQVSGARAQFMNDLHQLREKPDCFGRLDILLLDELRQRAFRRHGIADEMKRIKDRENTASLAALPDRLAAIDSMTEPRDRFLEIIHGMLAGNLFDMGVEETATKYAHGSVPLEEAMSMVPPRPWLVDHVDRAFDHFNCRGVRKAVVFVDNAGGDAILGLMPFARELLRRGAEVILTANSQPAHNDLTHEELRDLLPRIIAADTVFDSPHLQLVSSGNAAPLIDLRRVSHELAVAARGADLVVLVGMGRAMETNFSAVFTCAAMKIAMVKDVEVARSLGGKVYDAVFRFDDAAAN